MKAAAVVVGLMLGLAASPALAEPLNIASASLDRFALLSLATSFGPFTWRGGLELSSANAKFGGLSGLIMSGSCGSLLAVSDAGRWVRADVNYSDGRISGLTAASIAPILDAKGKPPVSKFMGDAEALGQGPGGTVVVGFESQARIGSYDVTRKGLKAPFSNLNPPKEIAKGPDNGELESVGYFSSGPLKGNYIAIAESNFDAQGFTKAWIWNGQRSFALSVRQLENYKITDLAILPDGDVMILQRSFSTTSLPGSAISRFPASAIAATKLVEPETLFEGKVPFYAIDNMEGMAVCERDGETRITLVSDNNFNTKIQRTLLLQFAYKPQ